MYNSHTKLNMGLFLVILLLLIGNFYMDKIEHKAMKKRLDEKNLLCIQVHKIESKHNYVLECSGILK